MARRPPTPAAGLLADPGVLEEQPTLEVFGFGGVSRVGGTAVLPGRGDWLEAHASDIDAAPGWKDLEPGVFDQAVVHLQKSRDATWQALSEAWDRLAPEGRLMLVGGNELGIKSAVKRLAVELDQPAGILVNRARARVACWRREDREGPVLPEVSPIEVATPTDSFTVESTPGAFSADAVDPGTALLLEHLERLDPPGRVFDPGCGLGVLAFAAIRRWPSSTAVLADIDHRVVECARATAVELELGGRCEVIWWDALREGPPLESCDLVLLNPPFHSGVPVDLQPARAIFRTIDAVLTPGGKALIVANRTLPWERDLREIGKLRQLTDDRGYKLLEVAR